MRKILPSAGSRTRQDLLACGDITGLPQEKLPTFFAIAVQPLCRAHRRRVETLESFEKDFCQERHSKGHLLPNPDVPMLIRLFPGSTRFGDWRGHAPVPAARRAAELDLLPIARGATSPRDQFAACLTSFHGKILLPYCEAVFNGIRHFWLSATARDTTHPYSLSTKNGFRTHLFGYAEFQPRSGNREFDLLVQQKSRELNMIKSSD